jgi:hypothetical protein
MLIGIAECCTQYASIMTTSTINTHTVTLPILVTRIRPSAVIPADSQAVSAL